MSETYRDLCDHGNPKFEPCTLCAEERAEVGDLSGVLQASIEKVQKENRMTSEVVKVQQIENQLGLLKSRAESVIVRDPDSYQVACQVALDGRQYIKNVGFELDPGIGSAKAHLDLLKTQKEKFIGPAKQIVEIAAQKAELWKSEERRKAAAEEERINADRRREAARIADEERKAAEKQAKLERERREAELKAQREAGEIGKREAAKQAKLAAEAQEAANILAAKQALETAANVQQVKVDTFVPKVAGIRARVNWKFRIIDAAKLPRKFLMADEVAIGQYVRANKENAAIPGVEVYGEDGI